MSIGKVIVGLPGDLPAGPAQQTHQWLQVLGPRADQLFHDFIEEVHKEVEAGRLSAEVPSNVIMNVAMIHTAKAAAMMCTVGDGTDEDAERIKAGISEGITKTFDLQLASLRKSWRKHRADA